jgi:hypothetical protein
MPEDASHKAGLVSYLFGPVFQFYAPTLLGFPPIATRHIGYILDMGLKLFENPQCNGRFTRTSRM